MKNISFEYHCNSLLNLWRLKDCTWLPTFNARTAAISREARRKKELNAINAAAATRKEGNMRPIKNRMKRKAQDSSNTARMRIKEWKNMR